MLKETFTSGAEFHREFGQAQGAAIQTLTVEGPLLLADRFAMLSAAYRLNQANQAAAALREGAAITETLETARGTGIQWGKGNTAQGLKWEDFLAKQLRSGSRLPPKFKTFDFFDRASGVATSAKTLNSGTSARIADPTKLYYALKRHIDAAATFSEYTLNGVTLSEAQITARELRVAVPRGTTAAQWQEINRAIQYAPRLESINAKSECDGESNCRTIEELMS